MLLSYGRSDPGPRLPLKNGLLLAGGVFAPALIAAASNETDSADAVASAQIRHSRLINRFIRTSGLRWVRTALAAGIPVLAIKGLATAHTLYPDPDARAMSDADLLVRRSDLPGLLDVYRAAGLEFRPVSAASRWGFVSDASYQALTSADGASNVDLHIHPDAWPLHRGLSTEQVFAEARDCALPDSALPVPCPLHILIMTVSHAARDRFGIETAKSFVDTALLLHRHGPDIDWLQFDDICRRARMRGPAQAYFALLEALGGDVSRIPVALRQRPGRAEFDRALSTLVRLDTTPPTNWAQLRREALLSSEPCVFLARMGLRMKGLWRPNLGLPPEG